MASESNDAQKPGGSGKAVPVLLAVNSLLLAGVLALLVLRPGGAPAPHDEEKPEKKEAAAGEEGQLPPGSPGPIVRLPDFVVHLSNPEADRYLRLVVEVELGKDSDRDLITTNMPRIRDAFIGYISDRTLEEMKGTEGMGMLRQALMQLLGEFLPRTSYRAVYITDFMVQ